MRHISLGIASGLGRRLSRRNYPMVYQCLEPMAQLLAYDAATRARDSAGYHHWAIWQPNGGVSDGTTIMVCSIHSANACVRLQCFHTRRDSSRGYQPWDWPLARRSVTTELLLWFVDDQPTTCVRLQCFHTSAGILVLDISLGIWQLARRWRQTELPLVYR